MLRAEASRNRERIIDAAHTVFRAGGHEVPMDRIAAEAGVGVATVYRRFPTREDLVRAVLVQRLTTAMTPALERARQNPDPRQAVLIALEAGVTCAVDERGTLAAASNIGARTMDLAERFFEPAADLIRRGQATGAFRADLVPEDAPRLLLMLLGTLPSFTPGSDGWRRYLHLLMDALTSPDGDLPPPEPLADHTPRL
jgi:AcrR family transcriptional regulator